MCYGHVIFTGGNSQKESRYLPSPIIAVVSGGYKTDFNLNNITVTLQ